MFKVCIQNTDLLAIVMDNILNMRIQMRQDRGTPLLTPLLRTNINVT